MQSLEQTPSITVAYRRAVIRANAEPAIPNWEQFDTAFFSAYPENERLARNRLPGKRAWVTMLAIAAISNYKTFTTSGGKTGKEASRLLCCFVKARASGDTSETAASLKVFCEYIPCALDLGEKIGDEFLRQIEGGGTKKSSEQKIRKSKITVTAVEQDNAASIKESLLNCAEFMKERLHEDADQIRLDRATSENTKLENFFNVYRLLSFKGFPASVAKTIMSLQRFEKNLDTVVASELARVSQLSTEAFMRSLERRFIVSQRIGKFGTWNEANLNPLLVPVLDGKTLTQVIRHKKEILLSTIEFLLQLPR